MWGKVSCLGKQHDGGDQGPVSRKCRYLFGLGKLFDVRDVYIKDSNSVGFKS